MTAHLELTARQVYAEAADLFGHLAPPPAYGFKVLYGPPLYRPPILFVGYQPGGSAPEGYNDRWPPVCQYATENWALAVKMRQLFGRELLERCCGVNAIFIRSPSMREYRRDYSRQVRAEVASFCLDRVASLVRAIEPVNLVVIGHGTLRLFGSTEAALRSATGRVLIRTGRVAGRPALAVLHLTGARISLQDLVAVRAEVLSSTNSRAEPEQLIGSEVSGDEG
jgi:hypothetical protein